MSRSAIKLHTPAGRKALDKMIHESERKAQELAASRPARPGAKAAQPAAAKPAATGAGEIRIIGGQWRRTRLVVAQKPGLRPTRTPWPRWRLTWTRSCTLPAAPWC